MNCDVKQMSKKNPHLLAHLCSMTLKRLHSHLLLS